MNKRQPVILGFVADLMLETRIAEVAQKAGFQVEWVGDADQIAAPQQPSGEHLVEPGVQLIDKLSDLQPALILLDLGNDDIPWQKWLQQPGPGQAVRCGHRRQRQPGRLPIGMACRLALAGQNLVR